jgi:hypothetical protein
MAGRALAVALGDHTERLKLDGRPEGDAAAYALADDDGERLAAYGERAVALCALADPGLDARDSVAVLKAFADINFEGQQVRKTPSWPRSWANSGIF